MPSEEGETDLTRDPEETEVEGQGALVDVSPPAAADDEDGRVPGGALPASGR